MNKKEFIGFMTEKMKRLNDEAKIKLLRKIQDNYIPTMIQRIQKRYGYWIDPKDKDKYTYCTECKRYSLAKKCKEESFREVREEVTYTDAGYGDDDKAGYVEYVVDYSTCPLCGYKQEKKKHYIRTIREWNIREGR